MERAESSPSTTGNGGGSSANACNTKVEPIRLTQDWTIENFSPLLKLCKPGHCLRSHVFRHESLTDATWQLCLYPAGKRAENQGYISLFLKMSSTTPNREILVTAEYKFHFLDDTRQIKFVNVNVGDFHAKPPKCGHSWGLRNIPRQRVIQALRSDGSLMVHCEIEFLPDPCRLRSHALKAVPQTVDKDLLPVAQTYVDDMLAMYENGIFTDCRIIVEPRSRMPTSQNLVYNERCSSSVKSTTDSNDDCENDDSDDEECCTSVSFNAHKCILSARSRVFRAMFENESVIESEQNAVTITDFTASTVESMLKYVYSGDVAESSLSHRADELLALAEKYCFNHLKLVCEEFLSTKICADSVCQTYALADLHRADYLKQACMNYIGVNRRDVLHSDNWLALKEHNPKLANELLEHLLQINNNSDNSEQPPPEKRSKFSENSSFRCLRRL